MSTKILKPKQVLNKALLKVKPKRNEIYFKSNLTKLIDHSNEVESEEFDKNSIENKKQDSTSNVKTLKTEIDQLVHELYDLSEEEIGIVEGGER